MVANRKRRVAPSPVRLSPTAFAPLAPSERPRVLVDDNHCGSAAAALSGACNGDEAPPSELVVRLDALLSPPSPHLSRHSIVLPNTVEFDATPLPVYRFGEARPRSPSPTLSAGDAYSDFLASLSRDSNLPLAPLSPAPPLHPLHQPVVLRTRTRSTRRRRRSAAAAEGATRVASSSATTALARAPSRARVSDIPMTASARLQTGRTRATARRVTERRTMRRRSAVRRRRPLSAGGLTSEGHQRLPVGYS